MILVVVLLLLFAIYFFKKKTLVYVYSDTCPHCINFMPDWAEISKNYPNTLKLEGAEAKSQGIAAPYYPYIYLKYSIGPLSLNRVYSGERTAKAILAWV